LKFHEGKKMSRTTGGILTGTSTLFVIAILIIIQLIVLKHNFRFDLTENKRYSLSEQTGKVLKNLDGKIHVYYFYNENDQNSASIKDLLAGYKSITSDFSFQFIDPDKDPILAEKFNVKTYSTSVVTYQDSHRKVTENTEKGITNAIVKLTRGQKVKTIYFLNLHGELDIDSLEPLGINLLRMNLEDANYKVSNLNLFQSDGVPEDCTILAVVGPKKDLESSELISIRDYLSNEGNLLVFIDPQSAPKLCSLLAEYGIIVGDDFIIDPNGYENILQPVIETYPSHEITEDFVYGTIFNISRSVSPLEPAPPGLTCQSIAETNEKTWTLNDIGDAEEISAELEKKKDGEGPISIGSVTVINNINQQKTDIQQRNIGNTDHEIKTKIVVYGDSDFINNALIQSIGNNVLVMNTIHWLAEEKDLIAIPPKDPLSQPMQLTSAQIASAFWFPVVLIPLIILGFGTVLIYTRRKHG